MNQDMRDLPRYTLPEVATYVRMNRRTLGTWVRGRAGAPPLIHRPREADPRLSYNNLIEVYVTHVLRSQMGVPLQAIRHGVEHVRRVHGIDRFLLSDRLRARPGNLLIEALAGEKIENVGLGGQYEITEVVSRYLDRIDYSEGLPVGLYPVTRTNDPGGPKRVVIYPDVSFGRPVIESHAIATAVIFDRFQAGESLSELADDYDLSAQDIEEAIRAESFQAAA